MVLINVLINNLIIDFLGLAAISWINTMRNNKTTLGLMSNGKDDNDWIKCCITWEVV